MKIKPILLIATGCLLMICGCKDDKPKYGAAINLKVFGVSGKADIASDLKLGLFVDSPVGIDNEPITVSDNGTVLSAKDIKWAFDQSQASRFFVYAPYDESFRKQEFAPVVSPSDQSTKDKMLKGNILVSMSSGDPGQTFVSMKLKHAMTAMTISFDNRTGSRITDVTVSGFMTEGKLNLITGVLSATSGKKVITPLRSAPENDTFSFIYIPQVATPTFNVTLASGRKIVFTYNNPCNEHPDKIIRMNIQIDESTPDINILELNGVNTVQWASNGVPEMPAGSHYVNLAGLRNVETDPKDHNYFSAFINKVTVTAVDRTDKDYLGVILEDESKAIHVWTNPGTVLEVGNTVVGEVWGYMEKPSGDELYITNFYTRYATVAKTDSLPCTQGSFGALADSIGFWEYRRMIFKDVRLQEAFNGDRGVFAQGVTNISVVCPGMDISLAEGIRGDLIGFPVRNGSDVMIMVYDESQFDSFTKYNADNAFTRCSKYGLYDLQPDTALFVMKGADMEYQYSVRCFDYGRTLQTSDTRNGEVYMFLMYDCTDKPIVGHEYETAYNVMCNSGEKGSTMFMECVKVDDNTAWLVDRSGKHGLILAL